VNIRQTLIKVKSVFEHSDYIGFEPNPRCIYYVNRLIKLNNFKGASILPVGISEKTEVGQLNFYYGSESDSLVSTLSNFRPDQKIFRSEYTALFDIETLKKNIDLSDFSVLKIDVEGSELKVIKSFKNEIAHNRPIILMEILPAYFESNIDKITRQNEIVKILKAFHYSTYRVIKKDEVLLNFVETFKIEVRSDLNNCE